MMATEPEATTIPAAADTARGDDRRRSRAATRLLVAPGARIVRTFYGSIAVVLAATLIAQCVLTHREGRSLVNTFSYFTIQSNVLVLIAAAVLARRTAAPRVTGFAQAPSHYPYEFLDVDRVSLVEVVGSIAFVSVLLVGIGVGYIALSRRLVDRRP